MVAATFLRLNNIGMVERRTAVLDADEHGTNADIKNRLYDLQRYTVAHMNTGTGQFYLEHQYKRDSQERVKQASQGADASGNIYKQASNVCDSQFAYYSSAYLQCFMNELDKHPASKNIPSQINLPPSDLYRHEFIAPLWSPDFAGWSVAVCLLLTLIIVVRLLALGVLKLLLRRHYQSI